MTMYIFVVIAEAVLKILSEIRCIHNNKDKN